MQKWAINIWQDFFRSVSVHELLFAIVFFSNGFEIHLLYSQLSLNKHLFRRTTLWCWPLSLSSHLTVTMLFIYFTSFLDTGLPRGNVHERDSGPMRSAIPIQSHNP